MNATGLSGLRSASPQQRVLLNGYAPTIVEPAPAQRVTLFGEPHTDAGDSGVALIDSQHRVVGFALERSHFSVEHASSSWSWADQVMRRHRLIRAARTVRSPDRAPRILRVPGCSADHGQVGIRARNGRGSACPTVTPAPHPWNFPA